MITTDLQKGTDQNKAIRVFVCICCYSSVDRCVSGRTVLQSRLSDVVYQRRAMGCAADP